MLGLSWGSVLPFNQVSRHKMHSKDILAEDRRAIELLYEFLARFVPDTEV